MPKYIKESRRDCCIVRVSLVGCTRVNGKAQRIVLFHGTTAHGQWVQWVQRALKILMVTNIPKYNNR